VGALRTAWPLTVWRFRLEVAHGCRAGVGYWLSAPGAPRPGVRATNRRSSCLAPVAYFSELGLGPLELTIWRSRQ